VFIKDNITLLFFPVISLNTPFEIDNIHENCCQENNKGLRAYISISSFFSSIKTSLTRKLFQPINTLYPELFCKYDIPTLPRSKTIELPEYW
jgi:hypothetical protein